MPTTTIDNFVETMNRYGADKEPFLFIIDFEMKNPEIHKISSVHPGIKFITPLVSNAYRGHQITRHVSLKKHPIKFSKYSDAFNNVHMNISLGNSYLLNLTFPTPVETDMTLEEIFDASVAKYKLLYHDKFVVFSPEIFVRISDGVIKSFPMKGTIDASLADAESVLINDEKEKAEHNTIVDLIRNDLSKVADNVNVTKFRYIDRIRSGVSELLQVSSEISGKLDTGYMEKLGSIIVGMLPAGSVTGAPKMETLRIIKESEKYRRGWYTGVFGVFDGNSLDSAVMIRFIEKDNDKLLFKSGGGITYMSDAVKEYEELIAKIYVPTG